MYWLWKVFVVLILIMSLVFMGLAMAVYATHKNWKAVIDGSPGSPGMRQKLADAEQQNTQLIAQHNRKVEELEAEKDAAEQQVRKLETERAGLVTRNQGIQAELDKLNQDIADATAAVSATQANNDKLAAEVTNLRQQIRTAQQARDAAFKETLAATERLHQLTGEYETARERMEQLTQQVAGMRTVMQSRDIDPNTDPSGVVPTVDGVVSQVRRVPGDQLVEFTIGSDDGLKEGDTVIVYRGNRYLGRLAILETSPDKSVGRVERRYQQGQIQEGDRVATRLKL
jgi:predicted RNase H-like nuclease (RuvC/YqgF family)